MKKTAKLIKKIRNPAETKRVQEWATKLEDAKTAYSTVQDNIVKYQSYYDGTKSITTTTNKKAKDAILVRNASYEIIEAQVENSIPYPKVTPNNEEDAPQAKLIESALVNLVKTLDLDIINDMSERDTPIKGGDFFLVEWDNKKGTHNSIGGVTISEIDPINFIPQQGTTKIEDMDYYFIRQAMTKKAVKRKYHVDVEKADEEDSSVRGEDSSTDTPDIVTVNMAYYKSDTDKIGLYVWCDDYELYNNDNYQCRELEFCAKCGAIKTDEVCDCGSKKFIKEKQTEEELFEPHMLADGTELSPYIEEERMLIDENGEPILDEMGNPVMQPTIVSRKIPYYQPNIYPVVVRKNVSAKNQLLGCSDIKVIMDQQEMANKVVSKIAEKILKGGSYVTLPESVEVRKTGEELNVIRIESYAQKEMIGVINIQPTIDKDMTFLEANYQWMRETLGITNSFQGKYDSSAKSGTAKQYAINQAAGRLESKHVMKASAYAQIYEIIFKTWLAYADQPMEISTKNEEGQLEFLKLDRFMFLKKDDAGEFYWNDEFAFETNPTSTLMANREAMWQQADLKLQSGAFGPLGELPTLQLFWDFLEKNSYPNAGTIKLSIDKRIETQKMQQQQMMQQQIQQGGGENVMPGM